MSYGEMVATQCPDCKTWFKSESKKGFGRAKELTLAKYERHLPCPDADPIFSRTKKGAQ